MTDRDTALFLKCALLHTVIPEIQSLMGTLSSGQMDTESNSSNNRQETNCDEINGLKPKLTKQDSRSTFELRDTEDLSPYTSDQTILK